MLRIKRQQLATVLITATLLGGTCGAATAAVHIEGQAQAGGGPLANATVTLWAGSSSDPRQLAQTRTGTDGSFQLNSQENIGGDVILYLTAQGGAAAVSKSSGDNPAIAWLSVLGNAPPAKTVINEMTTVASVWTNAQFLNGTVLKGHPLGLRIAAGNVPSFVDLQTGGWGTTIQDSLNSSQTPTMANFATLADLLSACATRVTADACSKLFAAATDPRGNAPKDTLAAAQIDRALSLVPSRAAFRSAGRALSDPRRQNDAPGAVHAVPELPTECLGAAAEVRRRRLSRRRQGNVRQRRQPVGR